MTRILQTLFALYAVYRIVVAILSATTSNLGSMWFALSISTLICVAAVGVVMARKWGWNAAMMLMGFEIARTTIMLVAVMFGALSEYSAARDVILREAAFTCPVSLALLVLLIVRRRDFVSHFDITVSGDTPATAKINSYTKPLGVGLLLFAAGICALAIPTGDPTNPSILGLAFMILICIGTALCMLERRLMAVRVAAVLAMLSPLYGLAINLSGQGFLGGTLVLGTTQVVMGLLALVVARRSDTAFVD